MDQHMTSHGRVESERLGADRAFVRTFTGVTSLVVAHLVQSRKMTSAVVTGVRTLTCENTAGFKHPRTYQG